MAPGFVDLHTHYDAQLFWDPNASPSPLHGVTTVLGGNCGFSLAPLAPEGADYISRMMARVEGMPLAALQAGLPWDWGSFGDWLGRLDGRIAVNAGFLVGPLDAAAARHGRSGRSAGAATAADVDAMEAALHAALADGALGFSTSQVHTHNDGDGQPVPSRAASREEMERLAAAVRAHEGTTVELIVAGCLNGFTDDEIDFLATMSLLADRPVNWNVLGVSAMNPDGAWSQLAAGTRGRGPRRHRGRAHAATHHADPPELRARRHPRRPPGLARGVRAPVRRAHGRGVSDPETRRRLDAGSQSDEAGILRHLAQWDRLIFDETFAPENAGARRAQRRRGGRERGASALRRAARRRGGRRPAHRPAPTHRESEEDWVLRAQAWQDPRAIVGGSDAGAHLDTMCGAIYSTSMLGDGVRARGLLSWEQAVRQLTDIPARLYGLRDRGRLVPGAYADVVVFDPTSHRPQRRAHPRRPARWGEPPLRRGDAASCHVLVNGTEIARDGDFTGAVPGQRAALGPRHRHRARRVRLGRRRRLSGRPQRTAALRAGGSRSGVSRVVSPSLVRSRPASPPPR